jgi:multiple sugar transport system permease protein
METPGPSSPPIVSAVDDRVPLPQERVVVRRFRPWRKVAAGGAVHAILIVGALAMIGPLVWMVLASFKTGADAERFFQTPHDLIAILRALWPDPPTLENYRAVFTERPMGAYYLNSAIYTLGRMLPSLLLCSMGGYVFAKLRFPGRGWLFGAVLLTLMVPLQVKILTLYEMIVRFGWVDTYLSVIIVGIAEPFGIFLFRQTIAEIPDELLEAARMDGAGFFRQYWSVVLPLIKPTLAAYSIFLFMWSWSDFLWPLVAINTEALKPIEVGILGFVDVNNPDYVKMMAAATVTVAPVLAFFLLMQRQFIRGVTMTGLKG